MYQYIKLMGTGVPIGVSLYDNCAKALSADGKDQPAGMTAKQWVISNVGHIKARISSKEAKQRRALSGVAEDAFLFSFEWRRTRMVAIKKYGNRCQCCGASPETGAVIHVDHIKPRRYFPELALDVDNLQILCQDCNHGKGSWDMTDWRNQPATAGIS